MEVSFADPHHLCFALKTTKRRGVNYPSAIALKWPANITRSVWLRPMESRLEERRTESAPDSRGVAHTLRALRTRLRGQNITAGRRKIRDGGLRSDIFREKH